MEHVIYTDRLVLKILTSDDAHIVTEFLKRGRDLFEKYESKKVDNYYTESYQKNVLDAEFSAMLTKKYLRYYVFKRNNPNLVIGTVSFGNVSDTPYNSSTIGYKFDPFFHHQGYAFEAINGVLDTAFSYLRLHRLLAVIMPENEASIRLIEKVGFKREGLMEKAINIRGQWEDHFLYALLAPNENT